MGSTRKDEGSIKVLVIDEKKGHYAFLKEMYNQSEENKIRLYSKFNYEQLTSFLYKKDIQMVVIFVYGRRFKHKILNFMSLNINIVVCAHESDFCWLTDLFPEIDLIDLSLLKGELFNNIDRVVRVKMIKE